MMGFNILLEAVFLPRRSRLEETSNPPRDPSSAWPQALCLWGWGRWGGKEGKEEGTPVSVRLRGGASSFMFSLRLLQHCQHLSVYLSVLVANKSTLLNSNILVSSLSHLLSASSASPTRWLLAAHYVPASALKQKSQRVKGDRKKDGK